MRMSVGPSCAKTEPSTYSTMEWTVDCGMDDDIDLVGTDVEKPAGLDDLETFVHHGGGIDGDAVAHAPVGMREGLLGSDGAELAERRFAEGAAGGGEDRGA